MKLLLTSFGFTTPEIVNTAVELTGKRLEDITVVIINEAHHGWPGDKHWMIGELNAIAKAFPGKVDIANIQSLVATDWIGQLVGADIIYVLGGNTDYLMQVFQKINMEDRIANLLKDKVYVGSSAGSMILAERAPDDTYERIYGEMSGEGVTSYLNLLPFIIMPHFDSHFFTNSRKESIAKESENNATPMILIRDDQAVIVKGEDIISVGGKVLVLINGREAALSDVASSLHE